MTILETILCIRLNIIKQVFLKVFGNINDNVFIKIYGRNNIIIRTLKNCAFTAKLMNINNVHVVLNLPCV